MGRGGGADGEMGGLVRLLPVGRHSESVPEDVQNFFFHKESMMYRKMYNDMTLRWVSEMFSVSSF